MVVHTTFVARMIIYRTYDAEAVITSTVTVPVVVVLELVAAVI